MKPETTPLIGSSNTLIVKEKNRSKYVRSLRGDTFRAVTVR